MYDELVKALRETRERVKKHPDAAMYVPSYQLSAAADVIEELQNPHWVPVTERLPEENEEVLVVAVNVSHNNDRWVAIDWLYCGTWQQHAIVTHWMPLPEPPKEEV